MSDERLAPSVAPPALRTGFPHMARIRVADSGISIFTGVGTPPIIGVDRTNQRSEASAMKPTKALAPGHPGYPQRPSIAERLVHETPLAIAAALHRAHDRARSLENTLELEALDPRVATLYRAARDLRRAIAVALVDVSIDATSTRVGDCPECLAGLEACEAGASAGGGRCCSECAHA